MEFQRAPWPDLPAIVNLRGLCAATGWELGTVTEPFLGALNYAQECPDLNVRYALFCALRRELATRVEACGVDFDGPRGIN